MSKSSGASDRPAFPFVVGCGRSGTTLLRAMLAAHPDMWVPPESYWIERMLGLRSRLERDGGFDADLFCRELASDARFQAWGLPIEEVRRLVRDEPPADTAEAVRAVYRRYSEQEGRVRYADKTPIYILDIPALAGLLPEARFVHLIRDGRDVAASYARVPWGPRTFVGAVTRWRRHVTIGRRGGRRLGADRYLEMRYEDLVAQPEAQLRQLCDFIGLDFRPDMLDFAASSERVLRSTAHRDHVDGVANPLDARRRTWRENLDRGEIERFEAMAGSLSSTLGYEPGHAPAAGSRIVWWSATRLLGGGQRVAEGFKRTRLAMSIRPVVRVVKRRLGMRID